MPINNSDTDEVRKQDLFNLLQTKGFEPEAVKKGEDSVTAVRADGFNFTFKVKNKKIATFRIQLDDSKNFMLFFSVDAVNKKSSVFKAWTDFIEEISKWARTNGYKGFKADPLDKLPEYIKSSEQTNIKLAEGYYGTRQTSYSEATDPTVKLIIKHSKSLEESDKRYRHVEKIFVENALGERFLLPTKNTVVGHAFARHIANGGSPYDERGKHISTLAEDISTLGGFIRATRNKQFNESASSIVYEAAAKYLELRETMKKLRGSRGFAQYFENWKPTLMETGSDTTLETSFTHTTLDERIKAAIPVLNRYSIGMNSLQEAVQLHEKMNGDVDELFNLLDDSSDPLPLGPDASNAIGVISEFIDDELLFRRLKRAAYADSNNDAKSIIIGWISEHVDDNEMFAEVLEKIEEKNISSSDANDTSVSTSDADNNMDTDSDSSVTPKPVPPQSSKKLGNPSDEAGEMADVIKNMPPGKNTQQSSPLPEDKDLRRMLKLSGIG